MLNYFDTVYVVSLHERQDRRLIIEEEMKKEEIDFTFFDAVKDDIGWIGLMQTMRILFFDAAYKNKKNILIFEDDATFLFSDIKWRMANILKQLKEDYHCLYLGCNLAFEPKKVSPNLLKVNAAYSTHAIAYGCDAIKMIADLLINSNPEEPYDSFLVNNIQSLDKCYCVYPMLVSQKPGYSDIEKRVVNYDRLFGKRFLERTKHL